MSSETSDAVIPKHPAVVDSGLAHGETPAINAGAVDSTAVDASAVDAPKADNTIATDAPATETPAVETTEVVKAEAVDSTILADNTGKEDETAADSSTAAGSSTTAESTVDTSGSVTSGDSNQIPVVQVDLTGKPLLVFTAPPVMGHTTPLLRLSKEMISRGYEVIFMSILDFQKAIEKTGAEFYESKTPFAEIEYLKSRHLLPPGLLTICADMENMFIKQMAPRAAELGSLLQLVRERDPTRNVVVITETMSLAPLPFMYGAPLPKGYDKFPKTINISTVPIMVLSIDSGITGPCLPPDSTESGRARNKFINQMVVNGPLGGTNKVFHKSLQEFGCTSLPQTFFQNAWMDSYNTTFQMCVPSLEYPRSDLHLSIRFCGALPKGAIDPNFPYPSWWSEIKANGELPPGDRKKVVAVAQGTVALDYADLIIPTVHGLAERSDVITVVILGVRDATLPETDDFKIPSNACVIDFLPYDAILEYADIFITNGGYGGLAHGVLNGVPMILSGTTEDKAEVCARGAHAGFAIDLRSQRPTGDQVQQACDKIFTTPSYKHAAMRLMHENEDLDSVAIIEREIVKYAKAA
jgi:hypothetical protein